MRLSSVLSTVSILFTPAVIPAPNCPTLLEKASRLVLVTFEHMNSPSANLRLFERRGLRETWHPFDSPAPSVLGVNGAAWAHAFRHLGAPGDPVKREGDHRTPAGIFALGQPFGFAASSLPRYLQLEPETVCVDDPRSDAYNTIMRLRDLGPELSVEHMHRGSLYRRGLVVDYPTNAALRAGSCIFIHVWKGPTSGTAGCIALQEARVAAVQEFAAQPTAAVAVLPRRALDRLPGCLPPR